MLNKIAEISEKRPYVVIALIGLISLGMIYGASQITMTSEMEEFLPQDYTSVKVTNILENEIGGTTSEIILIEGDNLGSAKNLEMIVNLQAKLHSNFDNYVLRAQSYTNYITPILRDISENRIGTDNWRTLPEPQLEMTIKNLLSQPQIRKQTGSYLTENRNAALVTVLVNSKLSDTELREHTKALEDYVESLGENHEDLDANVTGTISMEMETQSMMNRDNQILVPIAIIVVIVILYLAFKRFSDTAAPFLVLGLGALWMIGTMGILGIPFTMVYVALVPIILGIGIDYTIHMLNRYYEERGKAFDAEKSAIRSVKTVGVAIALTAITTIIGFASFGTSDMPPIRNFGFLAAGGVFFIFLLATTMLPSILTLRDRGKENEKERRVTKKRDRVGLGLSKIEKSVQKHKRPILIGTIVISILCVIPASGITTTMNFDTFLPEGVESVSTMNKVEEHFGGQESAFVLVEGNVLNPESLRDIKNLEDSITENEIGENLIAGSSSLTDLILYSENSIPPSKSQINMALSKIRAAHPEQLGRLLLSENRTVIYFSICGSTDKEMEKATELIRTSVRKFSNEEETDVKFAVDGDPAVGGSPPIISDVMESIMPSMKSSIILAIILVGVVLSLVFRSALIGLIGALPVSLALVWEFGALGLLGWPLDVMNMMVSALAIGIGVDFSIHIIHRFKEEWSSNGKSPEESVKITIQSVGRAISAAAATTIGVFVVLSFSRMPPIVKFGELAALVIFFALVGAMIVLPSILLAYGKWKEK